MEIRGAGNVKGLRFSVRRLGGRGFSAVNHLEDQAQSFRLKTSQAYLRGRSSNIEGRKHGGGQPKCQERPGTAS